MLAVFALVVASVPVAGGRLAKLVGARVRWPGLVAVAVALQVFAVEGPAGRAAAGLHVLSYLVGAGYLVVNLHLPGLWLIAVGGAMNLAAIAANGGVMPASAAALSAAGITEPSGGFANSAVVDRPNLAFLGDVFAFPGVGILRNVFSLGDVVIGIGAFVAVHRLSGSRLIARAATDRVVPWDRRSRSLVGAIAAGWVGVFGTTLGVAAWGDAAGVSAFLGGQLAGAFGAALVLGPLVDRIASASLLSGAAIGRALVAAVLLGAGGGGPRGLVVAGVIVGVLDGLAWPAMRAFVAEVVSLKATLAAFGILTALFAGLAASIGGIASGPLREIGATPVLATALVGLITSALLFGVSPATRRRGEPGGGATLWGDLMAGVNAVDSSEALRALLLAFAIVWLAIGFGAPDPYALLGIGHRRLHGLGLTAGAFVASSGLGALFALWPARDIARRLALALALAGLALGASEIGGVAAVGLLAIAGALLGLAVAITTALGAALSPSFARGRVLALLWSVALGSMVVGRWLGRAMAASGAERGATVGAGIALLAAGALVSRSRQELSVAGLGIDEAEELVPRAETADVLGDLAQQPGLGHGGGVRGVRRDDAVVQVPERVAEREGFGIGDVEGSPTDHIVAERVDEVVGDDMAASGDVDEPGVVLHRTELFAPDDAAGLGRERESEHDGVGIAQRVEDAVRPDGPCRTCNWLGISANDCCLYSERPEQAEQGTADAASTDDRHAALVENPS